MSEFRRFLLVVFTAAVALTLIGVYFFHTLAAGQSVSQGNAVIEMIAIGFTAMPIELIVIDIIISEYFGASDGYVAAGAIAIGVSYLASASSLGWFSLFP